MAKQYKVKDINNNGIIDNWEQGKYDAINNSATKMGYSMKMGSKENYSPTNFKTKDATLMDQSPIMKTDPKNESSEKQKNHAPGTNYGWADHKDKKGVRGGFNRAFKRAKAGGYDTFSFAYDRNKDNSVTGDEVKIYSTKTK